MSMVAADLCFFDDPPLFVNGTAGILASGESVARAGRQISLGNNNLHGADVAAGNQTQQLLGFMLGDLDRAAFLVNASSPSGDVARVRADNAELETLIAAIDRQRAALWILDGMSKWRPAACGDALDGAVVMWATAFVVGCLAFCLSGCAFWGEKRFAGDTSGRGADDDWWS